MVFNNPIKYFDYLGREANGYDNKGDSSGKYIVKLVSENGKDFLVKVQATAGEQKAIAEATKKAVSKSLTNVKSSIYTGKIIYYSAQNPTGIPHYSQKIANGLVAMVPDQKYPINKGAVTQGTLDFYSYFLWVSGGEDKLYKDFAIKANAFCKNPNTENCQETCDSMRNYIAGTPGTGYWGMVLASYMHTTCYTKCCKLSTGL
jgi:hypothetical protein